MKAVRPGNGKYRIDPEHTVPLPLVRPEHDPEDGMVLVAETDAEVPEVVLPDLVIDLVEVFLRPDRLFMKVLHHFTPRTETHVLMALSMKSGTFTPSTTTAPAMIVITAMLKTLPRPWGPLP